MKSLTLIFTFFLVSILFVQCTIEKRLYNRGFHVEWTKKPHAPKNENSSEQKINATILFTPQEFITTHSDSTIEITPTKEVVVDNSTDRSITQKEHSAENSLDDSFSPIKTKDASIKKVEDDGEVRKPVNKALLTLAIISGVIFLTLLILIFVLNPAGSPLAIALGTGLFGVISMILFSKIFKKEQTIKDDDSREPINKRRLLFAIISGIVFLTLMTLIIALNPINLSFIILPTGVIGVVSMILFAKTFKKKHGEQMIKDEKTGEQEKKSNSNFDRKKNAAIAMTILTILALSLTTIFIISSSTGFAAVLGALFFGLLALIFLFVTAILWASTSDAKKDLSQTNEQEVSDKTKEEKVIGPDESLPKKHREWVLLVFLAIITTVVLLGKQL